MPKLPRIPGKQAIRTFARVSLVALFCLGCRSRMVTASSDRTYEMVFFVLQEAQTNGLPLSIGVTSTCFDGHGKIISQAAGLNSAWPRKGPVAVMMPSGSRRPLPANTDIVGTDGWVLFSVETNKLGNVAMVARLHLRGDPGPVTDEPPEGASPSDWDRFLRRALPPSWWTGEPPGHPTACVK